MTKQKAQKVEPPQDMDAHNAEREDTPVEDAPAPAAILTTTEVAARLETTPRTLRKFLRSKGSGVDPVGQGRRYALTEASVPKLATKFETWKAKDEARRAAKADAKQSEDVTVEDEGDEELDEIEVVDEEPQWTREELEQFTVKELREMIHDSQGSDYVPAKGTKKAQLIDQLLN